MSLNDTLTPLRQKGCFVIYIDGSCSGNPGPGGYAAILCRYSDGKLQRRKTLTGGAIHTTNVSMELCAVTKALNMVPEDEMLPIVILVDSEFIVEGIRKHMHAWHANGWHKAKGKPVANSDLWKKIYAFNEGRRIMPYLKRDLLDDPLRKEVDDLALAVRNDWMREADKAA